VPASSGEECAQLLLVDGEPGLLEVLVEADGDPLPPHEEHAYLCEASDSFHPDNYSECTTVPDWTCDEVVAAATP